MIFCGQLLGAFLYYIVSAVETSKSSFRTVDSKRIRLSYAYPNQRSRNVGNQVLPVRLVSAHCYD